MMKIAVSSTGSTLESRMDQRFGRAKSYLIVETKTMTYDAFLNDTTKTFGGAGVASAQFVVDHGVNAVITGNVGPNAMSVLHSADITIYRGVDDTILQNVVLLQKGELETIDKTVEAHFGQSGQK